MPLRRIPAWAYMAIASIPLLVLVSADFIFSFSAPLDPIGRTSIMFAAIFWLIAFAVISWKRLDESGREAHKFAWYHGGGLGLIAGMIAVIVIPVLPAAGGLVDIAVNSWASKWPPGQGGFVLGVLFAAIVQSVGWAIAWSGWWLIRRR